MQTSLFEDKHALPNLALILSVVGEEIIKIQKVGAFWESNLFLDCFSTPTFLYLKL